MCYSVKPTLSSQNLHAAQTLSGKKAKTDVEITHPDIQPNPSTKENTTAKRIQLLEEVLSLADEVHRVQLQLLPASQKVQALLDEQNKIVHELFVSPEQFSECLRIAQENDVMLREQIEYVETDLANHASAIEDCETAIQSLTLLLKEQEGTLRQLRTLKKKTENEKFYHHYARREEGLEKDFAENQTHLARLHDKKKMAQDKKLASQSNYNEIMPKLKSTDEENRKGLQTMLAQEQLLQTYNQNQAKLKSLLQTKHSHETTLLALNAQLEKTREQLGTE